MAVYRFGSFELDTRTGELRRHPCRVRLRPQPCAALVYLIERPGQFVSRQELHRALWPEGTFVRFEDGLNSCVKQIRAALGDSRTTPRYLETLTRRGYRFIAPVLALSDRQTPDSHGRARVRIRLLPVRDLDAAAYGAAATRARPGSGPGSGPGPDTGSGVGFGATGATGIKPTAAAAFTGTSRAVADGLGEELIARLAVAAPRELAVVADGLLPGDEPSAGLEELATAVDYALVTSIRAAGAHARVTAQLIETRLRQHVWAGRFDLSLDDPLDAQAIVAEQIVRDIVIAIRDRVDDEESGVDGMNGRQFRTTRTLRTTSEGVTTHGA